MDTPLGTEIPNKRKGQGIVLLLLVFKHSYKWFAIPGRSEQGVSVWLSTCTTRLEEDEELSSVQEIWAKHVPRKELPAGDSCNMLCSHDIV